MREPVSLAFSERGEPTAMTWDDVDYVVTDTPTKLEYEQYFVTHPLAILPGWRFQGRPMTSDNKVFDVRLDVHRDQWLLVNVYV